MKENVQRISVQSYTVSHSMYFIFNSYTKGEIREYSQSTHLGDSCAGNEAKTALLAAGKCSLPPLTHLLLRHPHERDFTKQFVSIPCTPIMECSNDCKGKIFTPT